MLILMAITCLMYHFLPFLTGFRHFPARLTIFSPFLADFGQKAVSASGKCRVHQVSCEGSCLQNGGLTFLVCLYAKAQIRQAARPWRNSVRHAQRGCTPAPPTIYFVPLCGTRILRAPPPARVRGWTRPPVSAACLSSPPWREGKVPR